MAKLVEILARELKEWPEGVTAIEQERDGLTLYECRGPSLPIGVSENAEDSEKGVVTRAEWQAAVDALNHYSDEMERKKQAHLALVWNGVGLPLAGTVCEFKKHNPPSMDDSGWLSGDIRYISDCTVVIGGDGCEHVHHPRNCSFRPIRTPEQISAEEALREIEMLYREGGPAAVFDAGYRKQEPK